jgi:prevent-host-death family protein
MNAFSKIPTTITSREFNQNRSKIKREAKKGPIVITERGVPSLVVMSIETFEAMKGLADEPKPETGKPFRSLADVLADKSPEGDFEFDIPEFKGNVFKGFEFD